MVSEIPVPCHAVVFASRRTAGHAPEYAQAAHKLEARARTFPGFLGLESARDAEGFGLTVSYWRTEGDLMAWKADAVHTLAQVAGRERFYAAYEVRVARVERVYGYRASETGPPLAREITPVPIAEVALIDRLAALARTIGDEMLAMQQAAAAEPKGLVLRRKGPGDLVTLADEYSHRELVRCLAEIDPDLPLVLEESAAHEIPKGAFFVCDELDGTINYSRGRPGWGISLARVDGVPTHGVFYLPVHGAMVTAVRGEGCQINGVPVHLSGVERLTDAVASCELNPHHHVKLRRRYVDPLTVAALTTTVPACAVDAALELLRGRTDLYLNCRGAKIWDFAATSLAVTEAGGTALAITDETAGAPLRWDAVEMGVLYVANRVLADECLGAFEAL